MKETSIRALMIAPGHRPHLTVLKNDLDSLQQAVSIGSSYKGYIEVLNLDDNVCLICNEEGNHKTKNVQRYRFDKLNECCQEVINFLNTVRVCSFDEERYILNRTYYVDLVVEWEINNKKRMPRRFIWI